MAAKSAKRPRKRRPGRPSKGPTVHVGMRIPKDLYEKVAQLRRETAELRTQTAAFEQLIREGLNARER